jgi:hypothetical protein
MYERSIRLVSGQISELDLKSPPAGVGPRRCVSRHILIYFYSLLDSLEAYGCMGTRLDTVWSTETVEFVNAVTGWMSPWKN